jgi:hypothetical protein
MLIISITTTQSMTPAAKTPCSVVKRTTTSPNARVTCRAVNSSFTCSYLLSFLICFGYHPSPTSSDEQQEIDPTFRDSLSSPFSCLPLSVFVSFSQKHRCSYLAVSQFRRTFSLPPPPGLSLVFYGYIRRIGMQFSDLVCLSKCHSLSTVPQSGVPQSIDTLDVRRAGVIKVLQDGSDRAGVLHTNP